jgi:hypothetical protein
MSARIRTAARSVVGLVLLVAGTAAGSADTAGPAAPVTDAAGAAQKVLDTASKLDGDPTLAAAVVVVVLGLLVFSLLWIRNAIQSSNWSLADALSEEADVTPLNAGVPVMNGAQPLVIRELRASSSRVIALLGAITILFMFVGFGTFVLYHYGTTGKMPDDVTDILKFLSGGLALFAPYAVNKISSVGSTGK